MTYKFSGVSGNQHLDSPISSAPFPTDWPMTVAGWVTWGDLPTNDEQPFGFGINGDANSRRVQISTDADNGAGGSDVDFIIKDTTSTFTSTLTLPASWVVNGQWMFIAYVLRADANRQGYLGYNGTVLTGNVDTSNVNYVAYDQVTFGHLQFFGGAFNNHQGLIGPWAMWNLALTPAQIAKMARGTPLMDMKRGLVDIWPMDGRHLSQPSPSINHKFPLTVTGTPAYSPIQPPINYPRRRNRRFKVPAAVTFQSSWAKGANTVLGAGSVA